MAQLPITERSNDLTEDLDLSSGEEMLRIFRQSDGQLFSGWKHFPGLFDNIFLSAIEKISSIISETLENQNGSVIMSGAGTSGRLAFLCSRAFNFQLVKLGKKPIFDYLIAGGDKALLTAQEQSEDDTLAAVRDLQTVEQSQSINNTIIYIGITCGLSAPYVAAQLDYIMNYNESSTGNKINYIPILMGFSPVEFSRNAPIEKWDQSFFQVAKRLESLTGNSLHYKNESKQQYFILNPVVGPETVTGSTRMKGGSATKILLETLFVRALSILQSNNSNVASPHTYFDSVEQILFTFERVYREAYISITHSLSPIVQMCGECLSSSGHLYYLSENSSFGILSLVDASECPPTFGAHINDVKAFIASGWSIMENKDGDLSKLPVVTVPQPLELVRKTATPLEMEIFKIDLFNERFSIGNNDAVIVLRSHGESLSDRLIELLQSMKRQGAQLALVTIGKRSNAENINDSLFQHNFSASLTHDNFLDSSFFSELALKYTLNAISTGAHILKGKILKNRMVDVRVSNAKLFDRSVRIVSQFSGTNEEVARLCLLKSIYGVDSVDESVTATPVSKHIEKAFQQDKIVPKAILIATGKFTVKTASEALETQPVVRKVLLSLNTN